jgi:putative transposase
MPRMRRAVVPGMPHHVTQRGNRRADIFLDIDDRIVFLRMLKQASHKYSLRHSAYSLMTNHVHLVSIPSDEQSLPKGLGETFGAYAAYFNQKYGINGRLWQGRYFSSVLSSDDFWCVVRYVERNPVRARMVARAVEYRWSSAAAHCGFQEDPVAESLPPLPDYIRNWSERLISEEDQAQLRYIRTCTRSGYPIGPASFWYQVEYVLQRRLVRGKKGRPARAKTSDSIDLFPHENR